MTPSRLQRIYLDNAATTPVDGEVLAAMTPYFSEVFGNPSSQHAYGREGGNAVTAARDGIAKALGISPAELCFTSCGTEADNLGIKGIALANRDRGRHIVISAIEHPAVIESAKDLAALHGFEVTFVNADKSGIVRPQSIISALREDTVLAALMSANNETGVIQPVAELYPELAARGVYLWCDCVQTAGVLPLSLFPADGRAISAHKFYGPKGVGGAWIRRGVKFVRQMSGGHQERGLRGGTTNTPLIVGMEAALNLSLSRAGRENARIAAVRDLFERTVTGLVGGVHVNGGESSRLPSHSNLSFEGCEGQNLVFLLDIAGVAASAGAACSSGATSPSHVLAAMGLEEDRVRSAVRFSFGRMNGEEDAVNAARAVAEAVAKARAK